MNNEIVYMALGFSAQILFSARMLIQWFLSEKAKKVVSPTIYWQLSLLASFIFSIYGWLRGDFAIILGQLFSYYVYIWNLNKKNHWKSIPVLFRSAILITPLIALTFVVLNGEESVDKLFGTVPAGLLVFGSIGQLIMTFRFVYQWLYSRKRDESILSSGFWGISLLGSLITIVYAIFRLDIVLLIGQGTGFITYGRNLYLSLREKKELTDKNI